MTFEEAKQTLIVHVLSKKRGKPHREAYNEKFAEIEQGIVYGPNETPSKLWKQVQSAFMLKLAQDSIDHDAGGFDDGFEKLFDED